MNTLYNINKNNFIEVLQEVVKLAKELKPTGFAECEKEQVQKLHKLIN